MYVCTYVLFMYICIYIRTCTYIHIGLCTHVCMYTCIYVPRKHFSVVNFWRLIMMHWVLRLPSISKTHKWLNSKDLFVIMWLIGDLVMWLTYWRSCEWWIMWLTGCVWISNSSKVPMKNIAVNLSSKRAILASYIHNRVIVTWQSLVGVRICMYIPDKDITQLHQIL